MANPFLFVVGCPRSGTTLLQRMLDAHPLLAVANDTHFIPKLLAQHAEPEPPVTARMVQWLIGDRRSQRLGVSHEAVERAASAPVDFAGFVGRLYDELARLRGKPLAGEKTPDYVRHLPLLHGLFPWARSVHIIRDPRDTILSILEWSRDERGPARFDLWRRDRVGTATLWWRRMVREGRAAAAALGPDRVHEVRYESLVAEPEAELRRVSGFLELPFEDAMLAYHEGRTRAGRSAKSAWLPPTRGVRAWRSQMARRDVELIDALAGDLLDELGYQRGGDGCSAAIAAAARACRAWWACNTRTAAPEPARAGSGAA